MWDTLSAYADGEVTPAEAARVERHLACCQACADVLAFIRDTADLLEDTPIVEPPAGLREQILQATVWERPPAKTTPQRALAWRWQMRLSLAGAACACALLLILALPSLPRFQTHTLVDRVPTALRPVAAGATAFASRAGRATEKLGELARSNLRPTPPPAVRQDEEPTPEHEGATGTPIRVAIGGPARVSGGRRSAPLHNVRAPSRSLSPFLNPERSDPPVGSPSEGAGAAPAPTPSDPVVARRNDDAGPATATQPIAEAPTVRPTHSIVLASHTANSEASVATMAELRRALRTVRETSGPEIALADHREVTLNVLQSRF